MGKGYSITDLALGAPSPENLQKSLVSEFGADPGGSAYPVPKSWFNDPYSLLDSMGLGYRASPTNLGYETLRQMVEKNVVLAAIVQTRVNQVASFCQPQRNKYSVGYKIIPRDRTKKLSDADKDKVRKYEAFIQGMGLDKNPDRDTLEFWARKVVRDRLTYDQLCSEKVPRRNGKPFAVYAVPAETIRMASPKHKKGTPLTPYEAERTPKYVQVVEGVITRDYSRKEMIFRVANPRTDLKVNGYGYSEAEMLVRTVTAHLWAEQWNEKVFSQGATVKGILNIKGNIHAQQLDAFRRQWLTQVSGVTNAWRTPILNSDELQWIPLQPNNTEMGYQGWMEYLIKVACAIYLIDPAEINFDTRGGVGQQPMFMTTNEAQQKVSKDRGLQPLLRFLQTVINEDILWEIDDEYEFVFFGLDSRTESEAIELRMKELQSYKSLNDVRREADDLPPVPHGELPMNPTYIGFLTQQMSMQMQAQQQGGGQQPGPPQGPEAFGQMFSQKPPGSADAGLGAKMMRDHGPKALTAPAAKPEEHSLEEASDPWEETIHASENVETSDELRKAIDAFRDLE